MENEAEKGNVTPDGPEMWMFHQCRYKPNSSRLVVFVILSFTSKADLN